MVHLLVARSHLHEAIMHVVVIGALWLVDRKLLVVHLRGGNATLFSHHGLAVQVSPRNTAWRVSMLAVCSSAVETSRRAKFIQPASL